LLEELVVEAEAAANRDQEIPVAGVPGAIPSDLEPRTQIPRPRRIAWATLLRRVFGFDPMSCPHCLTPMVVLAFITDPKSLVKILEHLGLPTSPPPIAPVRLPVEIELSFDEQSDDEVCSEKPLAKLAKLHRRQSRAAPL
jgi:hypothetical protein